MTSQPTLSHLFLILFFLTTVTCGQIFGQPYFPVKIDQKWGLIDTSGQIVVTPQYDLIGTPQQFGYTFSQSNGKLGLLNVAGKAMLPTQYDDIAIIDSNFFRVTEARKDKIINTQSNAILSADKFTEIKVITPTILAYAINGQYGCINEQGEVLLPTSYNDISLFKNRYLQLHRGKHRGLATFDGKVILEPIADQFEYHSDSLIFYQKGVLWGALDDFGNHLITPQYSSYKAINQRLFKLERFGEFWLYDKQSQKVISKQPQQDFYHFSNQYIKTRRGNKFGIIDYAGRTILENQYEVLHPFSSEAFCVEQAGKWGIIGQNGQQILPYQYDYISPIRSGRSLLKKGALFGLADEKGTLLLPAVYTKINISKDKIKAFKGEKWTLFYFDDAGNIQRGNDFKKHFKIRVANQNIDNEPNRLFNGSFDEGNRVGDFEWFYDITKGKWGLRQLSDGEVTIKPTYDFIQIERDLGYTLVGIEKQGQYRFGLTDYRFNYVYGIVNNEVGKLVTHLKLWDVRASDFRSGSEVARVVFSNGRHGLMLRNGKFLKKDFGYIGAFKNGLAKFSIGGKIS
ncbi:MAG: WG repeat-containing protein, partial [Bacteroidota bacterium]